MKKRLFRIGLRIFGLPASLLLIVALAFKLANRSNGWLVSSGKRRAYLLHMPKTVRPGVPAPLVISIHGFAEWPAHQMQISRWNALAEREGIIMVYPAGTQLPLRWRTNGAPGSAQDPALDTAFIADLIDKLCAEYSIDPQRIYVNGLSNGGGMSFVLSCQLSERIAAVGVVAGAYLYPWGACQPARPVPAVIFHGTADPVVPYQGGPSGSFHLPFPSIPDWVETLARRNGCTGAPRAFTVSENVSGVQYGSADAAGEVVFYTIHGGGHSWPGGLPLPKMIVGVTSQEIDATQTMWEFFTRHPLETAALGTAARRSPQS